MTAENERRTSFNYLRSICRSLPERLALGTAIKNGWSAEALTTVGDSFGGPSGMIIRTRKRAYREAIRIGAERLYTAGEPYWLMPKATPIDGDVATTAERHAA